MKLGLRHGLRFGCAALAVPLLALAGCDQPAARVVNPPLNVLAQKVAMQSWDREMVLTGAVRARVQTELSFRISGRVIERQGDVGQHVAADAILAKLDPVEQQADLDSAKAGLAGAEASWRQAKATYDRQKSLLASGFTTHAAYELADQGLRDAVGALDFGRAQLASAQDAMTYTQLHAGRPGVITARNIEVGQVAQAAQSAFSFAEDGPRDAVFAVYETPSSNPPDTNSVELALVSDTNVTAPGHMREVSPVIDSRTGTIQVKVQIDGDATKFPLGAAINGLVRWRVSEVAVLPWTALTSRGDAPAVWTIDPTSNRVALRPVTIAAYEKERVVVRGGLSPGQLVVTEGGKFLREDQMVRIQNQESLQGEALR